MNKSSGIARDGGLERLARTDLLARGLLVDRFAGAGLWLGQVPFSRIVFVGCAGLTLIAAEADLERHLAAAREAERVKDYARAGAEYQKILRVQPNLALIHQSLALTYHLRNQFSDAIPEFNRAIQLDASLWGSFLFLGMDLYKTNQFEKAVAALEKSVSLNAAQGEPEARFWLGVARMALGQPEEAIREFRRASELQPKNIEVFFQLAKAYNEQASILFERIGKIEPRCAAVSLLQAEHFLSENRPDLAGVEYRHALRLRPDYQGAIPALDKSGGTEKAENIEITEADARALFSLAAYWSTNGNPATAAELTDRLSGMKPSGDGARQYISAARHPGQAPGTAWPALFEARRYAEVNDFAHAEETLQRLLAQDARNVDTLLSLGRTYQTWARLLLDSMIAIDRDSYRVHQLAGDQHDESGRYEQAIASYRTALAKQPDVAGVRYALGGVYWKLRQYDPAERWLSEELKRNPNHGLAHYRLGSIYTEESKPDEAILHLRKALETHVRLTAAHFDLGRALLLKGRYTEAVAEFQKVAADEPDNDRVHYQLANAYRKLGRNEDAQVELAKYQELTRRRLDRVQQDVRDASRSLVNKP